MSYQAKRNLSESSEPKWSIHRRKRGNLRFVIQKHAASRLHYDFRLEVEGVLKSWAVPKGPSMDPSVKRLAIMVEDHPYGYKDFEGIIPRGYGAGTVMIWDEGTYSVDEEDGAESERKMVEGLKKGALHFTLDGIKLKGAFALVSLKKDHEWLLIKQKDKFFINEDILTFDRSVVSGRNLEEIANDK